MILEFNEDFFKKNKDFFNNKITYQEWCDQTCKSYTDKKFSKQILYKLADKIKLLNGFDKTIKTLVDNNIVLHIVSGNFVEVIKYVLGILVIIAFAIIYLYIAKIIILRDIPSNQIFRILATLFIIGFPIWTMSKSFENNDLMNFKNIIRPYHPDGGRCCRAVYATL